VKTLNATQNAAAEHCLSISNNIISQDFQPQIKQVVVGNQKDCIKQTA